MERGKVPTTGKLVLALVLTSQKLMHYFQAHPIAIYIEFQQKKYFNQNRPIRSTLQMEHRAWTIEHKIFAKGGNKIPSFG